MELPSDLTSISDPQLDSLFQGLLIEIVTEQAKIETGPQTRKRTRKVIQGTVLNVVGVALSVPTGGISFILCAAGFFDWAEAIVEDASIMNEQNRLRNSLAEHRAIYAKLSAEGARRGRKVPTLPGAPP